jgi:hypothetical protein
MMGQTDWAGEGWLLQQLLATQATNRGSCHAMMAETGVAPFQAVLHGASSIHS